VKLLEKLRLAGLRKVVQEAVDACFKKTPYLKQAGLKAGEKSGQNDKCYRETSLTTCV